MATVILPIKQDGYPAYDFDVELDGSEYNLDFLWNERDEHWYFTLSDSEGDIIVAGVKIVVDWNLLRKCADARKPPGELIAIDTNEEGDPSRYEFGNRVQLIYIEAS